MAICIYESWTSIIVNVESMNRCYDGGILQFFIDRYSPPKTGFLSKIKSIFKSTPTIEDFDGIHDSSGVIVMGESGCDGNLFYFSSSDKSKINELDNELMKLGLVSNEESEECDYFIFTKKDFERGKKMLTSWLQIDFIEAADSTNDKSIQFAHVSIYPFKMPYLPSKFKTHQGGFGYTTQKQWEETQRAIKENNPSVVFGLSQICIRHLNASLWEEMPSLDSFIDAYISGDKSSIPSKFWYIFDGSKEHDDEKRRIIVLDNESLDSSKTTNEDIIIHDLAEAWRTLNAELIIKHLAPKFKYDSMWVIASLDCSGYADYIRGKFDTIMRTGSKIDVQEILERNAISLSQDGKEPIYYIIKIEDGKIIKGDMTAFLF